MTRTRKMTALIVAAGRGRRAGRALPKQWQSLAGKPVARWTLERFAPLGDLVMVIHPDDRDHAETVCAGLDVTLVDGASDRPDRFGPVWMRCARPRRITS